MDKAHGYGTDEPISRAGIEMQTQKREGERGMIERVALTHAHHRV